MKLLVTGASGFLGRFVVAEALRRGHAVRALVRPSADVRGLAGSSRPEVECVRADLRASQGLEAALPGVDAVLHLAAVKQGSLHAQLAGTLLGTENLLDAMAASGVRRLVVTSTFAVYDYGRLGRHARLDESSPVEGDPARRGDPYVQSKLAQEELLRRRAASDGLALTILRPGVVFGPGNLWSDRIGIRVGERWWLRFTGAGPLPLCYVENCAEAIVRCAECAATIGETFNVVDGELPTRRRYVRALRQHLAPRPRVVPLPSSAVRAAARVADGTARLLLGGSVRLPWFLSPARLGAQVGQQRTPNERLCAALGWRPRYGLAEALERSFEAPVPAAPSLAEAAVE